MGRNMRAALLGIGIGIGVILLLEGLGLAQAPKVNPNFRVALVNGEAIGLAEVDAVIKQRPMVATAPTATQIKQLRFETLSAMIDDLLLRQFMRERGPKIDPAEVEKQFTALQAALKTQGKSLEEYLKEVNESAAQVRSGMLMLLQLDKYVKDHTSEADLKKYHELNKAYFDKITVRTSHIVIRLPADAPPAERDQAKKKLQTLRAEIVAGKLDFAKVAKEHSQCPSAPKGGDIGYIQRKFQNVDEAYAKAAFALKVGDISDVVETDFGFHLIKATDRTAGSPLKYELCVDDVRDSYAEELRVALLNQLRKKAKVEVTLP